MSKRITGLLMSMLVIAGVANAAVEAPVTDGLLIGLDGSNVTMDGGNVQYWNDQAALGGAQNFYQATPTKRPSLLTNFTMPDGSTHDIMDFSGSGEYLSIGADSSMETNTITTFAVVRANAMEDGGSGYLISTADSKSDRRWQTGERGTPNQNWIILTTSDTGTDIFDLTGANQDEWYIVSMTWSGASTNDTLGARSLSEANNLKTATKSASTSAVYSHVRTRIGSNSAAAPTYYFNGQVAEILVYNRVLTSKDIAEVELYLKHKYFRTATVLPPVTDGLLIGLDGSDVMIASEKIRYWNDQAAEGGAANFYQGSLTIRPSLLTNFAMPNDTLHDIVDFDGINDYLSIGADSSLSTNTITSFVVVRGNALQDGNTGYVLASADSSVRWGTGERSTINNWFLLTRRTSSIAHIPNLTGVQDKWYIVSMSWNGPTGDVSNRVLSQDGDLVTNSENDVILTPSTTHARTRIGCNADLSTQHFFDGQIAEVLVYNRALPSSEVLSVEEYLSNKYLTGFNKGTLILIQ